MWFAEIDCGKAVKPSVTLGTGLTAEDTAKEDPEGLRAADTGIPHVSRFYTVERGSLGGAVRRLQTWMQDLGWPLEDDGEFGPLTEAAVQEFQRQQGLGADGIVGQKTWAALAAAR